MINLKNKGLNRKSIIYKQILYFYNLMEFYKSFFIITE